MKARNIFIGKLHAVMALMLMLMLVPVISLAAGPAKFTGAPECTPQGAADAHKLKIVDHSWRFKAGTNGATGTAVLECAIRLGLSPESPVPAITGMLAFFKDTDGAATATNANIRLMRMNYVGGVTSVGFYNSSDAGSTGQTVGFLPLAEVPASDMWYYRVELTRASTDFQIYFYGVVLYD